MAEPKDRPAREVPRFDERTELELDHLASISASDIAAAAQQWQADAPRQYKGLLGDVPKPGASLRTQD